MLLIRHAQSEWNFHFGRSRIDPGIHDPGLTEEGRRQAAEIAHSLADAKIRRLIVSPYRRTLETAALLLEALGQLDVSLDPRVRERRAFSCDTGTPPLQIAAQFPRFDFTALEERWWGEVIESVASLERRVASFVQDAPLLPQAHETAVVTHWGFIRCASGAEVGNTGAVRLELDTIQPPSTPRSRP